MPAYLIITMFRSWTATTCLLKLTTMQAAASRSVILTLVPTAPRNSQDHLTRLVFLWGARVPAMQASLLIRTTTQIVAQECTALPQPVHPQAFSIILTSNQIAQIHTCMLMMSRAALHFSHATRQTRRITPLRSAPEINTMYHSFHWTWLK